MEVVVNSTVLICDFITKGVLTDSCQFNYVISSEVVNKSTNINKLLLRPFIKSGKVRVEEMGDLSFSDIYYYTSTYELNRYTYYEFHSIDIAKKQNLRLLTDNSAMKQLAQFENVKILTAQQIEDILIRKINYEEVIKINKSDNM